MAIGNNEVNIRKSLDNGSKDAIHPSPTINSMVEAGDAIKGLTRMMSITIWGNRLKKLVLTHVKITKIRVESGTIVSIPMNFLLFLVIEEQIKPIPQEATIILSKRNIDSNTWLNDRSNDDPITKPNTKRKSIAKKE